MMDFSVLDLLCVEETQPCNSSVPIQSEEIFLSDSSLDSTFQKQNYVKDLDMSFVPWRCGMPLPSKAKQIVANVYYQLNLQNTHLKDSAIKRMTAELTGVGVASINRIKREYRTTGKVTTLGKKRPKARGTRVRTVIYDEFILSAIRRKVYEFYKRQEIATVKKVVDVVNKDKDLPSFKSRAMNNLLNDLNFKRVRKNRRSALLDRDEIVKWRRQYLRTIIRYRQENRNIVYLDETRFDVGDQDVFDTEMTSGISASSGKGSRLIIVHAGGSQGFVTGSLMIFVSKNTNDYRNEIDDRDFEEWFSKKLLPALPQRTVIVMDNESYHSVKKNPFPTVKWVKKDIRQWLTNQGIAWETALIKRELLDLAQLHQDACNEYVIDQLATKKGHEVLRLPPYHGDLNPFGMVWSFVKSYMAENNKTFKLEDVVQLTFDAFNQFTDDMWPAYVNHVVEVEREMWELDGMMEDVIDRVVISSNADPASGENSDYDSSMDDDPYQFLLLSQEDEQWLLQQGVPSVTADSS